MRSKICLFYFFLICPSVSSPVYFFLLILVFFHILMFKACLVDRWWLIFSFPYVHTRKNFFCECLWTITSAFSNIFITFDNQSDLQIYNFQWNSSSYLQASDFGLCKQRVLTILNWLVMRRFRFRYKKEFEQFRFLFFYFDYLTIEIFS
jgi:hypothetical protein